MFVLGNNIFVSLILDFFTNSKSKIALLHNLQRKCFWDIKLLVDEIVFCARWAKSLIKPTIVLFIFFFFYAQRLKSYLRLLRLKKYNFNWDILNGKFYTQWVLNLRNLSESVCWGLCSARHLYLFTLVIIGKTEMFFIPLSKQHFHGDIFH